jgi:hypothetical protein
MGTGISRRISPMAAEMDPGRWWVPEVVGSRLQRDGPPFYSCSAKGTGSSGTRQGQCYKMSP